MLRPYILLHWMFRIPPLDTERGLGGEVANQVGVGCVKHSRNGGFLEARGGEAKRNGVALHRRTTPLEFHGQRVPVPG